MMPAPREQEKGDILHVEDSLPAPGFDDEKYRIDDAPAYHEPPPFEKMSLYRVVKTYKYASLLCVLAAVGTLSDGFQVQMSGSIVALPGFINTFGDRQPNGKMKLNPQYVSLWGSLKNVFAILGGLVGSYPADRIGRRWMILVIQLIMIGACILEQFATHWTHWLGARFLDGFSVGMAQCCLNVYVSEMAPTPGRGALMSLVNLNYAIGQFLSSVALNVVSHDKPSNWRHAVLSQFALSGFAIICWAFLPESPRWQCAKGREEACKANLRKINGKVTGYDVDEEYHRLLMEIENSKVTAELKGGGSYIDVFRGTNLRRLIVSILPWHWQVAIGVPIMSTYSSYFYQMAGLSNPFNGTVATNVINIVVLIIAALIVERVGRRTLLICAAPVSILSLIIIGAVLRTDSSAKGVVLVVMACVWTAFYNLSAGAMGYIYVAETSTLRLRAKTTGIAVGIIQAFATIYVYIAPIMLNAPALGLSNTVFFWAGTGTMVYVLVFLLVPETKGRSYAELDELFERKIPAWKFRQTETEEDKKRKAIAVGGQA